MDNLEIYEQARTVPAEALKEITAGRLKGMSDINPMWRIKKLTEIFGPCGIGWWYEITDKRMEHDPATKQTAAFVDINLFIKMGGETSHPIPGTGGASFVSQERNGPYMSDECFKMALTDAISVAAKALGVAADIYFAKDRTKYTAPAAAPKPPPRCAKCGSVIEAYKNNGYDITPEAHAEGSKSRFGKVLCLNCIRAETERAKAEMEARLNDSADS